MLDWIKCIDGVLQVNEETFSKIGELRYFGSGWLLKNDDSEHYYLCGIPLTINECIVENCGEVSAFDVCVIVLGIKKKESVKRQANHEMLLKRYNVPEHFENVRFGVHGYFYDSVPGMDPEGDEISAFFVKYDDSHESVDVKANLSEVRK